MGFNMMQRTALRRPLWRSMIVSLNVHALDRARTPQPEVQKPSRTEVEAAVRTIIRWTEEDPERDGLIDTPARVARSLQEFFWVWTRSCSNSRKDFRGDRRLRRNDRAARHL